jgi:hypothetical protein
MKTGGAAGYRIISLPHSSVNRCPLRPLCHHCLFRCPDNPSSQYRMVTSGCLTHGVPLMNKYQWGKQYIFGKVVKQHAVKVTFPAHHADLTWCFPELKAGWFQATLQHPVVFRVGITVCTTKANSPPGLSNKEHHERSHTRNTA